jgi:HTH-type transcriptional regulator/antitoxin HigA
MSTVRADKQYMTLVKRFPLVPLRDELEFEQAVKLMRELAYQRSTLSSGQADYLTVLGGLIAEYEKQLPRLVATNMRPEEALRYLMNVNGLAQADLIDCVGYKSNLSSFLSGKRGLSKRAAIRLANYFKVSPALFLSTD